MFIFKKTGKARNENKPKNMISAIVVELISYNRRDLLSIA